MIGETNFKRIKTIPSVSSFSYKWILIALVGLSIGVRVIGLHGISLHSDEYSSLREAEVLGTNFSGIIYYSILHFWKELVSSVVWYRLLSVIFSLLTVPIAFYAGSVVTNRKGGLFTAFVVAISPFSVEYSQSLRHYSLYMLMSFVALGCVLHFVKKPKDLVITRYLVASIVIIPFTHFFGILLSGAILFFLYVAYGSWPSRRITRIFIVGFALCVGLTILLWPDARELGWQFVRRLFGAVGDVGYSTSRGFSISNIVKIPFSYYLFVFGNHVYPLDLVFVIPMCLIILLSLINGLKMFWRTKTLAILLLIIALVFVVFLVFDPLTPPYTETASARHVAMAWPAVIVLISVGAWLSRSKALALGLIMINLVGLGFRWYGDWSYGEADVDWMTAANLARESGHHSNAILYDGRSIGAVETYYVDNLNQYYIWPYLKGKDLSEVLDYERVTFLSSNYKEERIDNFNSLLAEIEGTHQFSDIFLDYPLFQISFDQKSPTSPNYSYIGETGQILQPLQIHGLEFQDIELPFYLHAEEVDFLIFGSFSISNLSDRNEFHLPLDLPYSPSRLVLISTMVDAKSLDYGTKVAEIEIFTENGVDQVFELGLGTETQLWDGKCDAEILCKNAYSWPKRIAFTGQRQYPQAWEDFDARLFSTEFQLHESGSITALAFRFLANEGSLYIWGIAVPPD